MPTGVYKRTAETRKILSIAHMGNTNAAGKRSDSFRQHMAKKSRGNTSHLGHSHSAETRERISKSRKGLTAKEKNPNWKGGISSIDYLERRRFQKEMQLKIFERDNFTCQLCGQRGGSLQVDHLQKWSDYPTLRFEITNCRTLCMACHYQVTFGKEKPKGIIWGHNLSRRIAS